MQGEKYFSFWGNFPQGASSLYMFFFFLFFHIILMNFLVHFSFITVSVWENGWLKTSYCNNMRQARISAIWHKAANVNEGVKKERWPTVIVFQNSHSSLITPFLHSFSSFLAFFFSFSRFIFIISLVIFFLYSSFPH